MFIKLSKFYTEKKETTFMFLSLKLLINKKLNKLYSIISHFCKKNCEKEELKVHKAILAANSSVFYAKFCHNTKKTNKILFRMVVSVLMRWITWFNYSFILDTQKTWKNHKRGSFGSGWQVLHWGFKNIVSSFSRKIKL